MVEAEVCAAVSDVLGRLGFSDFVIRLNHRGLLRGMLESFGVPAALHDQALVAVDKLDKIGRDGVAAELVTRGIPADAVERLLAAYAEPAGEGAVDRASANQRRLERAAAFVAGHADGEAAVANLRQIVALERRDERGPASARSTRAWRAACRTTRARSWRSPCRTWPAASAAAGATTV